MRTLLEFEDTDVIVEAVMNSFKAYAPKPFLKLVSSFFPDLNRAQIMEIPGGSCEVSVACSPCGRYVVSASNAIIIRADSRCIEERG